MGNSLSTATLHGWRIDALQKIAEAQRREHTADPGCSINPVPIMIEPAWLLEIINRLLIAEGEGVSKHGR